METESFLRQKIDELIKESATLKQSAIEIDREIRTLRQAVSFYDKRPKSFNGATRCVCGNTEFKGDRGLLVHITKMQSFHPEQIHHKSSLIGEE